MFDRCMNGISLIYSFFFFNDTATTEIYTLSLHDALPIFSRAASHARCTTASHNVWRRCPTTPCCIPVICIRRSEEHTSELQSHLNLVCRLLLEKKNTLCIMRLDQIFYDSVGSSHECDDNK